MLINRNGTTIPQFGWNYFKSKSAVKDETAYEAMREFLLKRVKKIRQTTDGFGLSELVGKDVLGDKFWNGTPLQGLYDYYYDHYNACKDAEERHQNACSEAGKLAGCILVDALVNDSSGQIFVQEKDESRQKPRKVYRLIESIGSKEMCKD